jgi:hypothetical protein
MNGEAEVVIGSARSGLGFFQVLAMLVGLWIRVANIALKSIP